MKNQSQYQYTYVCVCASHETESNLSQNWNKIRTQIDHRRPEQDAAKKLLLFFFFFALPWSCSMLPSPRPIEKPLVGDSTDLITNLSLNSCNSSSSKSLNLPPPEEDDPLLSIPASLQKLGKAVNNSSIEFRLGFWFSETEDTNFWQIYLPQPPPLSPSLSQGFFCQRLFLFL